MNDEEGTAAVIIGSRPPQPDIGLFVTQSEYDEIESRVTSLVKPEFDDVMNAIAAVLGQSIVDRMQGHVVGFEIVSELPDDRWFHTTTAVLN